MAYSNEQTPLMMAVKYGHTAIIGKEYTALLVLYHIKYQTPQAELQGTSPAWSLATHMLAVRC